MTNKLNIYDNRWWLVGLVFALFLSYLPTFQYDYLLLDDYSELYLVERDFAFYLFANGRVLQYFAQNFLHTLFTYNNTVHYELLRIIVFTVCSTFASIIYLFLTLYLPTRLTAFTLSVFMFTIPQLSVFFQWADLTFMVVAIIFAIIIFCILWSILSKLDNSKNKHIKMLCLFVVSSFILSIIGMMSQIAIFVPLFFVVFLLLFAKSTIDDNYAPSYLSLTIWQRILFLCKKFENEIFVVLTVIFASILYYIFLHLQMSYYNEINTANGTGNHDLRQVYDKTKINPLVFIITQFLAFISSRTTNYFVYFGFLGNGVGGVIYFITVLLIISTLYKEISLKKLNGNVFLRDINILKWLIIFASIFGAMSLGLLQTSLRILCIYSMIMVIVFIYCFLKVFNIEIWFHKLSQKLSCEVYVIKNYIMLAFIGFCVYSSATFNVMQGVVYYSSVEQLYLRATLINELKEKPNADTIYIKPMAKSTCYFGACVKELRAQSYGVIGNSWHKKATMYALNTIGIKKVDDYNIIYDEIFDNETDFYKAYPQLDKSQVITIDLQGLDNAFLSTFKGKRFTSSDHN